ncbi:hypothetical protein BJ912DRAFT_1066811 [Pholiota molesta]|nr:hypothetical protein BJ912DRAFT_1066811 [Pholiota molesta]
MVMTAPLIPGFSLLAICSHLLDPGSTNGSRFLSFLMRLLSGAPTFKEALEQHLPIHTFDLPIPTLIQSYDLFKPRKTPDWLGFFVVTRLADLPFWSPTKLLCSRIGGAEAEAIDCKRPWRKLRDVECCRGVAERRLVQCAQQQVTVEHPRMAMRAQPAACARRSAGQRAYERTVTASSERNLTTPLWSSEVATITLSDGAPPQQTAVPIAVPHPHAQTVPVGANNAYDVKGVYSGGYVHPSHNWLNLPTEGAPRGEFNASKGSTSSEVNIINANEQPQLIYCGGVNHALSAVATDLLQTPAGHGGFRMEMYITICLGKTLQLGTHRPYDDIAEDRFLVKPEWPDSSEAGPSGVQHNARQPNTVNPAP